MTLSDSWHVLPVDDLIDHEEFADCPCIPRVEVVPREDGSMGWVVTHAAWDGRE